MAGDYNNNFYDIIRNGTVQSAEVIVPTIFDLVNPKKVVDIGCGEGWWAKKFRDLGCEVLGIDGAYVTNTPLGMDFQAGNIDILGSLTALPRFDLAVCLEVAEHLLPVRSETFVSEIVNLAPTILWSAAIPRQPGVDHINCQWPSYWAGIFAKHGYVMSGSIRDQIWNNETVEPWFRQNLTLVTKTPELYPDYFPDNTVLDRTHPIIASWMR
jgi:SAM-dependent methyltransferase